ncbi:MAG: putative endonuclease [Acidimicrobiales bacterium]|jgi:putative endonuclease
MSHWFVYILRCADNALYCGVTTDIDRRLAEHNGEAKGQGAKCTRARRPVTLVYREPCTDRSAASKREWAIKQLPRVEKIKLIEK